MSRTTARRTFLWPVWLIAAAIVAIGAANAHLAYVAFSSDPGCVAHLKDKSEKQGQYRAAKSAC